MITAAQVRSALDYDPVTGVFTRRIGRHAGRKVGTRMAGGYVVINLAGKVHYAHRLAWLYMHGEWPVEDIDHINSIRDDNRFANLRSASRAENLVHKGTKNRSGFKGVLTHIDVRRKKRFGVQTAWGGEYKFHGWFKTAEEAGEVYRKAAVARFGEFAQW